jgi:hypothetical protein
MTASWRDVLPIHPAAELFPRMNPDELRALGEDINAHGLTSPIVLWKEKIESPPVLLDGRSRLDAMEAAGLEVEAKFYGSKGDPQSRAYVNFSYRQCAPGKETPISAKGVGGDPYAYVISANIHRRRLTAEQKRELIAKLLKVQPEQSNRQIAEKVKVDHKTVGSVRAEKESTGDSPVEKDRRQGPQGACETEAPDRRRLQARPCRKEGRGAQAADRDRCPRGHCPRRAVGAAAGICRLRHQSSEVRQRRS